jgi:hypothetical protein
MSLDSYYKFINNPNIEIFNFMLKNMQEFKKIYKLNEKQIKNIKNNLMEKHICNDKLKIKIRNSPILSATCFPIDFILPTKSQLWIVKKFDNVQKWILHRDCDFKQIYKKKELHSFVLNKKSIEKEYYIAKLKTKLHISSGKIAIGENIVYYENVKSGYYNIYDLAGSLLVAPVEYDSKKIFSSIFEYTGYGVGVDLGTYGFHDAKIFEILLENKKTKKRDILVPYEYQDLIQDLDKNTRKIFATGNNLMKLNNEKINKWISNNNLKKDVLSVYCDTKFGDGYYNVYKSSNMFLIANDNIKNLLNTLHNIFFGIS